MPIFGLVWVASWVGCFFPSSHDLLQAPIHSSCVLPDQSLNLVTAHNPPNEAKSTSLRLNSRLGSSNHLQANQLAGIAPKSTSENLLKAFKEFFQLAPISTKVNPAVVVNPVKGDRSSDQPHNLSVKRIGFGQCLPAQPGNRSTSSKSAERFQVKLKGSVVGEFLTRKQATQVTQKIERLLSDPTLKPSQIQPALVKGVAAVKWGDHLLFTLPNNLSQGMGCNPELLAIRWANNLRLALKEPALAIAEAQEQMYGLQTTNQTITGMASWYGPYFNGRQTATGETFNENEFTAAHPSLPFDTYLKVTNLHNGKSVIVRVNDRGPYFDNRTLDLSREAARSLDSEEPGIIEIEAVIMKPTSASTVVADTKLTAL
ncbi:septal ring lytic transglycosylase RlpA family protein [Kovacikia minuta CCNUW1]|uniref:septal ring lytic transglycosylase RlpA family protein n=1 Tax=Kovacikia minuta TaxID=2931930 RepID=UPI001CC9F697|nr:septal ring lytic transglycosylase RlpA family protein [Kovacikia minuta]UBF27044.1 septal ring lytic transglycosylase RlpA family protein [Kovacikia minuta CCNUW1]